MQAPTFTTSIKDYELFSDLRLTFTSIEDLTYGTACGGYSNEIVYVSGPLFRIDEPQGADLTQFMVNQLSLLEFAFEGSLDDI